MHFHLPEPLHGWRAFAGEVGVVLLGVLLALGAQQVVEDWRWRREVREAEQRLRREIGINLANAYERIAIDDCLRPRLARLRDELLQSDSNWPGTQAKLVNDVYQSKFPAVYRVPGRAWPQSSWRTALNSDVISHFSPDRAHQLADMFEAVSGLEEMQVAEVGLAATLSDLAFPGPISPAERRSSLRAVASLDALDGRILYASRGLIDAAREAGIGPDRQWLNGMMEQQRSYRGRCVREVSPAKAFSSADSSSANR